MRFYNKWIRDYLFLRCPQNYRYNILYMSTELEHVLKKIFIYQQNAFSLFHLFNAETWLNNTNIYCNEVTEVV